MMDRIAEPGFLNDGIVPDSDHSNLVGKPAARDPKQPLGAIGHKAKSGRVGV